MIIENNQIKKEDLKRIKELLIDIDMINAFVDINPHGKQISKDIVPFHQELLEEHQEKNSAINIFAIDEHTEGSREFQTFGPHALKDTEDCKVIYELNSWHNKWFDNALVFKKDCTNLILVPGFIELLKQLENLQKVKFIGCLSEICVKNAAITARNLFDQYNRDVEVCVYEHGIDTYDDKDHNREDVNAMALADMKLNGVKILTRKHE